LFDTALGFPSCCFARRGIVAYIHHHVYSKRGKHTVEDVIPLTMGNLRGHKMVYNEGWYVVTSSRKAFDFAKEHSIIRSGDALAEAVASAAGRGKDYKTNIASDVKGRQRAPNAL